MLPRQKIAWTHAASCGGFKNKLPKEPVPIWDYASQCATLRAGLHANNIVLYHARVALGTRALSWNPTLFSAWLLSAKSSSVVCHLTLLFALPGVGLATPVFPSQLHAIRVPPEAATRLRGLHWRSSEERPFSTRFHVFTCRILSERFATLPPSHRSTHRGALGLRGAAPGSALMQYLRTHAGQGRAVRQGRWQGGRQKALLQYPVFGQSAGGILHGNWVV